MGLIPGSDKNIERLTITAHKMIDCSDAATKDKTFVVQVNPQELEYTFGVNDISGSSTDDGKDYGISSTSAVGAGAPPSGFVGYQKMVMDFKFIADATGIVPIDKTMKAQFENAGKPSIKKHLELLQNTVYAYEKESHGPPFLQLVWGKVFPDTSNSDSKSAVFKGTLEKCTVKIVLFSLSGEPIKAEINLIIKSEIAPDAKPTGNSPDVTHQVLIQYGDKMSTHCNKIYGRFDSHICLAVAYYNNMVNWDLQNYVGKELTFPSIHLLQEKYLEEWETQRKIEQQKEAMNYETHYEHMLKMIGRTRVVSYFKDLNCDHNEPYAEHIYRVAKAKNWKNIEHHRTERDRVRAIIAEHGLKQDRAGWKDPLGGG